MSINSPKFFPILHILRINWLVDKTYLSNKAQLEWETPPILSIDTSQILNIISAILCDQMSLRVPMGITSFFLFLYQATPAGFCQVTIDNLLPINVNFYLS